MHTPSIQTVFEKKANAIIRTASTAEVVKVANDLLGYFGSDYMMYSLEDLVETEKRFLDKLEHCRKIGTPLILGWAEDISGISMYHIWEALSKDEGYHPDFHLVVVVSTKAPIEHLDELFRERFAILNEDGTFYRELEHA